MKLLPVVVLSFGLLSPVLGSAQQEGPQPTQVLIGVESKGTAPELKPSDVTINVNRQAVTPTNLVSVPRGGAQIALLIDDGLRLSIGRELGTLRSWISSLPDGAQIFIGYMTNGTVRPAVPFTTNHEEAAKGLRPPLGSPGISASPYICLSDFVKHWPPSNTPMGAHVVLMITNGVDPYNGSTSPLNQDSPYVSTAIRDAQRAGVAVYSIYFGDSGFYNRGWAPNFSGQSYLSQVAEATGGVSYYQGPRNPVSLDPYLKQFVQDIHESYVATFPATGRNLIRIKVKSNVSHVKVRSAEQVMPGNINLGPRE